MVGSGGMRHSIPTPAAGCEGDGTGWEGSGRVEGVHRRDLVGGRRKKQTGKREDGGPGRGRQRAARRSSAAGGIVGFVAAGTRNPHSKETRRRRRAAAPVGVEPASSQYVTAGLVRRRGAGAGRSDHARSRLLKRGRNRRIGLGRSRPHADLAVSEKCQGWHGRGRERASTTASIACAIQRRAQAMRLDDLALCRICSFASAGTMRPPAPCGLQPRERNRIRSWYSSEA